MMPSEILSEETYRLPAIPKRLTHGADELNFAEFPICGFSSNPAHRAGEVVTFEDQVPDPLNPGRTVSRKLQIIPASKDDPLGPLTPDDDWVLFGFIQLAKLQSWPKILRFSRYQLLKLLGWQTNARDYQKLHNSLLRLKAYQFRYYNGFFDAKAKSFVTVAFDLFTKVWIYEQENSRTRPKPNPHQDAFIFATSYVVWSDEIHDQFANKGVKGINFDFAKSLRRPLTRRLFRFLDKNFHWTEHLEYDLEQFSTAHLGLASGQEFRDLKKTIEPAIGELDRLGFLKPLTAKERYIKLRRSPKELSDLTDTAIATEKRKPRRFKYRIVFEKGSFDPTQHEKEIESWAEESSPKNQRMVQALTGRGISRKEATRMSSAFSSTIIRHHLDVFDFEIETGKQIPNPGGYLRTRISENYGDPPGFIPRAERERVSKEKLERSESKIKRAKLEKAERKKADEEHRKRIDDYWKSLPKEDRSEAERKAISNANRSQLEWLKHEGSLKKATMKNLLDSYAEAMIIGR